MDKKNEIEKAKEKDLLQIEEKVKEEEKKIKDKIQEKKENKYIGKDVYNIILLGVLVLVLFSITFFRMEGYKFSVEIGDIAKEDIRATTEIYDKLATNQLKKQAGDSIPARYRISPSVQISMKNSINTLFTNARSINSDENLGATEKVEALEEASDIRLSSKDLGRILKMKEADLTKLQNTLLDLTNQVMAVGIKEEDIEYEKENLDSTFESLDLNDIEKQLGLNIMTDIMRPNNFIDEVETNKRKEEAIEKVEPVMIKENEIIVAKGERIDKHKHDLIKESGLLKNADGIGIKSSIGTIMLILISTFYIYIYIKNYNSDILYDGRYLATLIIMFLVVLVSEFMFRLSPYLIPVSASALLLSVLIEPKLGIMVNMILSLFLGFLLRLDISIIFMLIVGGGIGVVAMKKQSERSTLLINGVIIGLSNMVVITAFGLIKQASFQILLSRNIQVFINGIISVVLAIGSLPLWENMFSILTSVKLGELANPNQPLIKKMLLEAPGTYHHSLMVGNLSEAGAEAIGADSLLARTGAYYHDIGKMKRPYYFKENQFGMENPHDKLSPEDSARIILSHATDGHKMALEHKLPKEIVAFTTEHHGTTAVAYFYYEAKKIAEEEGRELEVDMDFFRYKGQKPQSRETAVVMMADSVEAAVRSIDQPTKEKIEDMTRKVIQGKIDDGQFDECEITNKDINLIIPTFVKVLTGIYHDRISYPDMDKVDK